MAGGSAMSRIVLDADAFLRTDQADFGSAWRYGLSAAGSGELAVPGGQPTLTEP
jgi:hypothetical protein